MKKQQLPSVWQPGDLVQVVFTGNAVLKNCKVIKVSFTEHSEPVYDVEVPYEKGDYTESQRENNSTGYFRVHGIPQWFLSYTQKDYDEMRAEEEKAT